MSNGGSSLSGSGQPETGGVRISTESLSLQEIADLLGLEPDKAQQAYNLIKLLANETAQSYAQSYVREFAESRKREARVYQVSEAGLVEDIQAGVDFSKITNQTTENNIRSVLGQISAVAPEQIGPEQINRWLGELQGILTTSSDEERQEIRKMFDNLIRISQTYLMGRDELGAVAFSLTGDEIKMITSGIEGARQALEYWVSQIEKTNHPAEDHRNQYFYRAYTTTIGWLPLLARKHYTHIVIDGRVVTDREEIAKAVDELIKEFTIRIHTHDMKWVIEQNDWQKLQPVANTYSTAALIGGFAIKNIKTAFDLYQRFFERYRFAYGQLEREGGEVLKGVSLWRINPEIVAKIKEDVIAELTLNKEFYGVASDEEARRVANVAFNLFSVSMREAVHVARGQVVRQALKNDPSYLGQQRDLTKEASFQSDPNELLVNIYNPLQFAIEKWSRFGEPQKALFEKILLFLGQEDMERGRQEFNSLAAIVDFFSSGWRIDEVTKAIDKRLRYFGVTVNGVHREETEEERKRRLDSLATGLMLQWKNPMRLDDPNKPAERGKNLAEGKERLRLVAYYRPLELLKAYAVTIDKDGKPYTTGAVQDKFQAMLKNGEFKTSDGTVIDNYVLLEEVLGRYLYPIYEKAMAVGWDRLHGINVARAGTDADNPFDAEDYQLIVEVVDKINSRGGFNPKLKLNVASLQSLCSKIQDFLLEEETINDLATNGRHSHLYHRALYIDDAPLEKLEEAVDGIIPLSVQLFTAEGGRRDPVARIWGDTAAAALVQEHGMNAMMARTPEELLKELQEAMGAQTGYAGRPPYLKFLYSIGAGWLKLAKADALVAFLGLQDKLPFATSEFERLFGLAAPAEAPQDLRNIYEKMRLILGNPQTEPGGADLDTRFRDELGIQNYKIAMLVLSKVASIFLIFILSETFKKIGEEE